MNFLPRVALFCLTLLPIDAFSQFQGAVYIPDTATKVFAPGQEQTIAFAGGFNNPQLATGDINNDGRKDSPGYDRF
ncbi:MAG: hypothetical protein EOP49_47245 [Sphingobacteriales bacterium]|nr:MAG: hypothetical protein EOP49_47245 [Sphingobacteriales bacterium]